ncbi:MAG: putative flap endonuclease-1-like 5' DNA nuclease [Arcticibacterium sp.]|jgi:predicted flap endonuclease-1-like 5' DNA nuclease
MSKKKINFSVAPEIVGDATSGILLGEFNNWDKASGIELKKSKDGSLSTTVSLEAGKSYEYRYLLSDGRWVNDGNAEAYNFVLNYQIDNCVISIPEATPVKAKAAKKVTAKPAAKAVKATTEKADDLTKIEGVGKKIAELLVKEGIVSFELLGKATQKKLKEIIAAAGPRYTMHDPKTWAKQSKLAAAGKWDELTSLQTVLDGGK